MELKQLQYFLAVAETLNFSRAAERLYISQPNLSYQIAELEKELGTSLFTRDRRKVFLTPAGGALLPLARKTLDSAQEIRSLVQRGFPEEDTAKSISIALDSTEDHFESTGVTEVIAQFQLDYPAIAMDVRQQSSDACVKKLMEESLDAAFLVLRYNEKLPPLLNSKAIHRDNLVLVLPKDDSVHNCVEAMEKYSLVAVEDRPWGLNRVLHCLESLGVNAQVIMVDSIPVSFTYVHAGKGAIYLPRNYFNQHHYSNLMAIDIPGSESALTHVLAWNKLNRNSSIQLLVNSFPEASPEEEAAGEG